MKKYFLAGCTLLITIYSCKKESKLPEPEHVITLMKNDADLKDLFFSSLQWVKKTSYQIEKLHYDSLAIMSHVKEIKSAEHQKLLQQVVKLKARYKLERYSKQQAMEMISQSFKYYLRIERESVKMQQGKARNEEPGQQFGPPKNCYKWLIEDVSECDKEAVIGTGISLFGLIAGPVTYFIAQGTVFVQHSRCVDKAHVDYKRCRASEIAPDPNAPSSDTLVIYNPVDPNDTIIIY
ncbi:MAG: hypothetical protein H7122_05190 [Chitinophagaceae bacterium]|nr:hypothetical protein [Chitinophagaceae bacterium]